MIKQHKELSFCSGFLEKGKLIAKNHSKKELDDDEGHIDKSPYCLHMVVAIRADVLFKGKSNIDRIHYEADDKTTYHPFYEVVIIVS